MGSAGILVLVSIGLLFRFVLIKFWHCCKSSACMANLSVMFRLELASCVVERCVFSYVREETVTNKP